MVVSKPIQVVIPTKVGIFAGQDPRFLGDDHPGIKREQKQ